MLIMGRQRPPGKVRNQKIEVVKLGDRYKPTENERSKCLISCYREEHH